LRTVFYVGIPEYQDVADGCTEQLSSVIARELPDMASRVEQ
jgi:hypothetical protein